MSARRFALAAACAALVSATALATAPSAGATTASPHHGSSGTRSLAAVLAADGSGFDHNWNDFDILDNAVHAVLAAHPSSPVAVLADGNVRLTAFLPTDRAFRRLAHDLTGKWYQTESATFGALASAAGVSTIESVLLYHVVPGATLPAWKVLLSDGANLTTALGPTVRIDLRWHPKPAIVLVDKDPDAVNPRVILTALDINKGNKQIAHGIDEVLRPVNL